MSDEPGKTDSNPGIAVKRMQMGLRQSISAAEKLSLLKTSRVNLPVAIHCMQWGMALTIVACLRVSPKHMASYFLETEHGSKGISISSRKEILKALCLKCLEGKCSKFRGKQPSNYLNGRHFLIFIFRLDLTAAWKCRQF